MQRGRTNTDEKKAEKKPSGNTTPIGTGQRQGKNGGEHIKVQRQGKPFTIGRLASTTTQSKEKHGLLSIRSQRGAKPLLLHTLDRKRAK